MTDQLEQSLRDALSHQDAQLDQQSIVRLRGVDYRPRRHTLSRLPTVGVLGTAGTAAAVAVVVSLSSGAAPAFAGWKSTPRSAGSGQPAAVEQGCGQGLGSAVLTDSRGPYTAAIYAQDNTTAVCLSGNSISMASSSTTSSPVTVAAGQLEFSGGATRDSAGDQLTLADGRTGAGVTAVTLELSDGSTVQATVTDGWYMAWWPGAVTATKAEITTASGTTSVQVPAAPTFPQCPTGSQCSVGYASASGRVVSNVSGGTIASSGSQTAPGAGSPK